MICGFYLHIDHSLIVMRTFFNWFLSEFCEGHEVVILSDFNLSSIVWSDEGEILGCEGKVDRKFMNCFNAAGLTVGVGAYICLFRQHFRFVFDIRA